MPNQNLAAQLGLALEARSAFLDADHKTALRLYAGFYEGCPDLIADLYSKSLILFDYSKDERTGDNNLSIAQNFYIQNLPRIDCVIHKRRYASNPSARMGVIRFGNSPAQQIKEHGVTYAVDLMLNQDASFYLDTRNLRDWILHNATQWQLLNTFAYTGSLGVAALAGGASRVIQTDRSNKFMVLARQSAMINHFDLGAMKLLSNDFFSVVSRLKREAVLFDCVILDPPFFSSSSKGTVDLVNQSVRLINKIRPLIKDGGWLVTINNALFLSGTDYIESLEALCQDGYLSIERIIPIPKDITGFPETINNHPPADPAPFNHPTKIVILTVKRKA